MALHALRYIYGTNDQTSSKNTYNILYLLFIHSEFKENV